MAEEALSYKAPVMQDAAMIVESYDVPAALDPHAKFALLATFSVTLVNLSGEAGR